MNFVNPRTDDPYYQKGDFVPTILPDGSLDVASLLWTFQGLATAQVERLGLGEQFESDNHLYYVLVRMKGYFLKPLNKDSHYTYVTYPMQASALQMYRYAYLLDEKNEPVYYLISVWIGMDRTTRRIKPVKAFREKIREVLPLIEERLPLSEEKLGNLDISGLNLTFSDSHTVDEADLDMNGHMNNTRYFHHLQEKFSLKGMKNFEIDFERECLLSETYELYSDVNESAQFFVGKKTDGEISFKIIVNF